MLILNLSQKMVCKRWNSIRILSTRYILKFSKFIILKLKFKKIFLVDFVENAKELMGESFRNHSLWKNNSRFEELDGNFNTWLREFVDRKPQYRWLCEIDDNRFGDAAKTFMQCATSTSDVEAKQVCHDLMSWLSVILGVVSAFCKYVKALQD